MVDGVFFYWISWFFVICILFFMSSGSFRTYFSYWMLLSIMFSNYYISMHNQLIFCTYLILFSGSFLILGSLKKKMLLIFITLTIMIGYASLILFERISPIWFFGSNQIVGTITLAVLISILTHDFYDRVITGILGMCAGEGLCYLLMLNGYETIGALSFLDMLSSVILLLFVFYQYENLKKWLATLKANKTVS